MKQRSDCDRCGITVVEVLVVVGLIGLLVAMIVPAVVQSREKSRRVQCRSNLRQIVMAAHAFEAAQHSFPDVWFHSQIGPYLDVPEGATRASIFTCPSDPLATGVTKDHGVSYDTNGGSGADELAPDGFAVLKGMPRVTSGGIRDGLSNTAAYSEKLAWPPNPGRRIAWDDHPEWWIRVFRGTSVRHDNIDSLAEECELRALKPIRTWMAWAAYNHMLPPNRNSCVNATPLDRMQAVTSTSLHTGGVNTAMADGSVRFVAESIDRQVWRALGTRSGGEVISDF